MRLHTVKQPETKPAKQAAKPAAAKNKITFESVLNDALVGVSASVGALTDIVKSSETEPKDKIAAAKTLAQILLQLADAQVTENLPLLDELARNVRKSA